LAATNIPWDLDTALLRRLEKRIYIPLPTEIGLRTLFELNLKGMNIDSNINWDNIIKKCDLYSGADITNVTIFIILGLPRSSLHAYEKITFVTWRCQ
jgi:katanin p60 ATPase-containing subunit A1